MHDHNQNSIQQEAYGHVFAFGFFCLPQEDAKPKPVSRKFRPKRGSLPQTTIGGGGVNYQTLW